MRCFVCLLLWFAALQQLHARPVRVACIGASITEGALLQHAATQSYPAQLQQLAGNGYLVKNYGVSSATLLKKGDLSYWSTKAYQSALQFQPDILFIDLGGNDSKLVNRVHLDDFISDYHALIQSFKQRNQQVRIILLLPFPCFLTDTTQISDRVIVSKIIPLVQQVAYEAHCELLDMHSLFINQEQHMPDKIHPDLTGTTTIAQRLNNLLQQPRDTAFNIAAALPQPNQESAFCGYTCIDFTRNGHSCKVVQPKWAAPGHPWIWRARFWGHEPQTDIALLERGYHVVYEDVAELFGNAAAISLWNDFYTLLHTGGLAEKVALEGMSRGAVYALNWAAVHPQQVQCVYIDNPVLDLKSWPGGLGKVPPAEAELNQLKEDYGLTTPEDIRAFNNSPIDKTAAIAAGHYPILILCADADEAVPPEENTLLFEQKMKALRAPVTVVHKPGFHHHPHSLPNPTPIVQFITSSKR